MRTRLLPLALFAVLGVGLGAMLGACGDGNAAERARLEELIAENEAQREKNLEILAVLRRWEEQAQAERQELRDLHAELEAGLVELHDRLEEAELPVDEVTAQVSVMRCCTHLRQLAALFITEQIERPGRPRYDGSALLLHYRRKGLIQSGDEEVLLCDSDPLALRPGGEVESPAWDDVDLAAPPRGLCSYPFRAFSTHPLRREATEPQAIGCCPHHEEGAIVLFEDGSVRVFSHAALGLEPGAAIQVGPDSPAELLRPLVFRTR